MDLARWQEIKRLVQEALDLPEGDREAYIANVPDEDLRQEAEALLAVSASRADQFENYRAFPPSAQRGPALQNGDQVRHYTILRTLGHGGMGTVYVARDEKHERTVALKILLPRRFRPGGEEHRILARLSHPNIATLYDSGTTETGLRYVAMEHVEGSSITAYCEKHCPSVESRLAFFLKMCVAVAYAHQHLVVHRDLKPGNILVTAAGEPKLLDFGIAKLLPEGVAEATLTRPDERSLTLAFASPEQLGGEATTTATDIYALGVLLTLLLTGRLPYRVKSAYDLPFAIRNLEPEKPSDLVEPHKRQKEPEQLLALGPAPPETPQKLRKRLRGDLDAIALTALRKEPGRRYGTVSELMEDIRRYLADQPVSARKAGRRELARKFIRRHRQGVAVALLLSAVLVGSAVALVKEERQTLRERDKARREAERAEGVARFLVDMFKVRQPWSPGENVSAREVLDNGFLRLSAVSPSKPELRGTLGYALGKTYVNLGLYTPAEGLLAPALRDFERTRPGDRALISAVLADLGSLHYHQGRYAEADQYAGRALVLERGSRTEADSLSLLGHVAFARGDFPKAVSLFQKASALRSRAGDQARPILARDLNDLACAFFEEGRLKEAEGLLGRSLALRRETLGKDDFETLQSFHNLARLYEEEGRRSEAANIWKTLSAHTSRFEPYSPMTIAFLEGLAAYRGKQGEFREAESSLSDVLAFRRRVLPDAHPDIARLLADYGRLAHERRDYRTAESYYRESLGRLERSLGPNHPDRTSVGNDLAVLLAETGRSGEAETLWRDILKRIEKLSLRPSIGRAARENLTLLSRGKASVSPSQGFVLLSTVPLSLTEPGQPSEDAVPSPRLARSAPRQETIRFFDDFEGGLVDPGKWEYGGSAAEEDGQLRLTASVTDVTSWARTLPIPIDPTRPLAVSRRVKVHAANAYFDSLMSLNITGYPERRFGVSYANYHYTGSGECVTVGFSLFRFDANAHRYADRQRNASQLIEPLWDRWFEEKLVYDPLTGEVRYFIDGALRLSYNVGPLPPNASSVTISFMTWGWYTGHFQHLDNLVVRQ
jgi:serine/threonine-protein kinase